MNSEEKNIPDDATSTENNNAHEVEQTPPTNQENTDNSAEWKDRYTRLYAEFDNYRKRTSREKADIIKTASADILKNLLPVIDDFERAIKANENAVDPEALKEGFNLIYTKFKNTLDAKGLKPMDSLGQPFDVEFHEAITNIPAPSDDLKGKVVDVVEKGYFIHDAVLRYAKVVVGQ
jgi:molecular chaperone GrpE